MFTHLHVRSWFSFLAGGSSPEDLARRAASLGMNALAITDLHGVYGAVRFQQACRAEGIRSIIGAEVVVEGAPLVLLARSARGYANLSQLLTVAHLSTREAPSPDERPAHDQPMHDRPAVTLDQLADHAGDLLCLTGGREGHLYQLLAGRGRTQAARWLARLRELFGDHLYVEMAHYLRRHDDAMIARLHDLATHEKVPVVASGDVRYARHDDYGRYDLLTCIRHGITVYNGHPDRPINGEQYLKSEADIRRRIPHEEAFENTAAIADACVVDLLRGSIRTPGAHLPDGVSAADRLEALCTDALSLRYPNDRRFAKRHPAKRKERAGQQLHHELEVIRRLGLEEFFLVVAEVTSEARRRGIRCAGRGSAANSIVAYLLGITGVDPLEHNLLFERFLHGERRGTPDIDVDFDSDRRDEVIAWMEERFGIEQTAMTATVITYGLRMALRDVSKALGWPEETANELTKAVPSHYPSSVWEHRDKLVKIVGESALLDALLVKTAALEGCPRHLSLHSGGMVLSREPLYHYSPVQISANGVKQIQFAKDDVEALGLVKLDVLGLRMLAAVSEAVELIERSTGKVLPIDDVPLDDPAVYAMIREGENLGLFQIESQGQMHLVAQLQPREFDDIVVQIALFRPGPLQSGMVHPYIRRRRGIEAAEYEHPLLEEVLRDTYGVILFQEQVLEIAHTFAGLPMEEADRFRSLMSKFREPREMEGMRGRFVSGAMAQGVPEETAQSVFDKVAKFVGYGFCRSHAAAFAKTVYQSAYLKLYYPAAFMAAIMQHHPGMYSLMTLEEEAKRFGVPVLLPEINRSGTRYDLERLHDGRLAIRKPLTAVTELSAEDARAIVLERLDGPFTSVEDLYRRVPLSRDVLDNLARSGALDTIAKDSRRALWEVGVCARKITKPGRKCAAMLFELPAIEEEDVPELPPLADHERLTWDYVAQGSARRHPMILVRRSLNDLEIRPIATCRAFTASRLRPKGKPHPVLTIAGVVILRQMPPTAKGCMFLTLEDETGFIQCIAYPKFRERFDEVLRQPGLIVKGALQMLGNWRGVVIEQGWTLDGVFGGYSGYASAQGGMDTHIIQPQSELLPMS